MTTLGFVLVVLLASHSEVWARFLVEPTRIRLANTKMSATQDSCTDCTQMLELFTDMISKADTQELIKDNLDDICARMPGFEAQEACRNKVEQYLPIAIHFLVKFIKPGQACMFLGLCRGQSEGKKEELLTNYLAHGDMASMVPVRGTHPVVKVTPQCTFCMYILKKLESMLPKERTEEAIVKLLDEICDILPATYKDECESFIDKYGKEVIEFLLSSAAPHAICVMLHLCLYEELPVLELPPPSQCDSCQTLTALSRLHLSSNLTERRVSSFLESVCQLHPLAIPKCEVFTQRHGSRLQRILGKQGDTLDICQKEDLCVAGSEAMLGGNRCTWGRDYICADMKTALECDSVLFCQKYMWT